MKVFAEPVKGKDLQPGDLFSNVGQLYWTWALRRTNSIGEKCYIRTDTPLPEDQLKEEVYRLTVVR
jgi:hypothetical protein